MDTDKILSEAGLRSTRQRRVTLELLIREGVPMSHAEISSLLEEPLDKVTLYRTLETLKDANIVHQVQGLDGVWRFCAHVSSPGECPGDHPHFLCLSCGKMICLPGQRMQRVDVPEGCTVEGKQLVVYGCCADCAAKK